MQTRVGVVPSPWDERDIKYAMSMGDLETPDVYSLRDKQSPVRAQGGVPSCAAFAGTAINEFLHGCEVTLSPRHMYCARANAPGAGMTMRDACKIMKSQGVCTEACWEYVAHTSLCSSSEPCKDAARDAMQYRIGAYHRVFGSIEDALWTSKTPLFVCLPVYDGFPHITGKMRGYHGVDITGFVKGKTFEVKNSWGSWWGDGGYCNIAASYPVTEAWVLDSYTEPPVQHTFEIDNIRTGTVGFWGWDTTVTVNASASGVMTTCIDGRKQWFPARVDPGINVIKIRVPNKKGASDLQFAFSLPASGAVLNRHDALFTNVPTVELKPVV